MVTAAKALSVTAVDLFTDPSLVASAKTDFARQMSGKTYQSHIPENQKPPLDYRKRAAN